MNQIGRCQTLGQNHFVVDFDEAEDKAAVHHAEQIEEEKR